MTLEQEQVYLRSTALYWGASAAIAALSGDYWTSRLRAETAASYARRYLRVSEYVENFS